MPSLKTVIIALLILFIAGFTVGYSQAFAAFPVYTTGQGGTGTSTAPGYGKVLIGGANGEYEFVASSTLGAATGVTSFNGRTGAVTPQSGDYTTSQVTEGSNLYYTSARSLADFIANLAATTSVKSITTLPALSLPYSQLTGTPTIPTKTSDLTNDSGFITSSVMTLPSLSLPYSQLTGVPADFATTSVDYWLTTKSTSNLAEGSNLYFTNARADVRFITDLAATSSVKSITTLPSLSLPYSQLTGTPTIPTKTSDLTNDSGFITSASLFAYPFPGNATTTNITFSNGLTGTLTGNADTVTNGVYTTTFGNLFDVRLTATTTLPALTTLANLSTVGTITSGTWHGSAIADSYISSSGNWNTAYSDRLDTFNYPFAKSGTQLLFNGLGTTTPFTTGKLVAVEADDTLQSTSTIDLPQFATGILPAANGGLGADFSGAASGVMVWSNALGHPTISGPLSYANGGTDQSTWTKGDLLYASADNTLSKLGIGTGGYVLASVGGVPTWVATTTLANISGTLDVSKLSADSTTVNGTTCTLGSTCTITASTFAYLFPNNATSTTLSFTNGLIASASSTLAANGAGVATTTNVGDLVIGNDNIGTGYHAFKFVCPSGTYSTSDSIGGCANWNFNHANAGLNLASNGGGNILDIDAYATSGTTQPIRVESTVTNQSAINVQAAPDDLGAYKWSANRSGTVNTAAISLDGSTSSYVGQLIFGLCAAGNGACIHLSDSGSHNIFTLLGGGYFGIASNTPGMALSVGGLFGVSSTTGSFFGTYASTTALSATSLCLSTDCRTSWPSSTGTGLSTTSPLSAGNLLVYNASGAGSAYGIATSTTGTASTILALDALTHTTIPYASTTVISSSGSAYFATSGGNVGIGTTTPAAALAVQDTNNQSFTFGTLTNATTYFGITPSGGAPTASNYILASNGISNLTLLNSPSGTVNLRTGNTDRLVITSSGNVGIGDSSPAALLTVGSGDLFQVDSSGAIAAVTGITSSGVLHLTSAANSYFTGGGNVGIGNSSPGYPLDVKPSSGNSIVNISAPSGSAARLRFEDQGVRNWSITASSTIVNGSLIIAKDNESNAVLTMSGANGAVGIGTTTPSGPDTASGIVSSSHSLLTLQGGQTPGIMIWNSAFGGWGTQIISSNSGNTIINSTRTCCSDILFENHGATERMRITDSGLVGIGTTTPVDKLDVFSSGNGDNAEITGNTFNTALALVNWATGGKTFTFSSTGNGHASGNGKLILYNGAVSGTPMMTFDSATNNVGIGTTTPAYALTSYAASAPQFSLSAGAGIAGWAMRVETNGTLDIASTTVAGNATTTTAAISIPTAATTTFRNANGFRFEANGGAFCIIPGSSTTTLQGC